MLDLLKKKINFSEPPKILLVFGEEEFLVEEALHIIIDQLLKQSISEFELERYNAEELPLSNLAEIANTSSLLANRRILFVKNAEKYLQKASSKKEVTKSPFAKYLEKPSENTILLLQASHSSLNGLTKQISGKTSSSSSKKIGFPFDEIINNYNWLEFPKVWPNEYPKWIDNRAKKMGLSIQPAAIELLISKAGDGLRNLANELEKLFVYLNGRTVVTLDDVMEIAGSSKDYTVFDLQKSIAMKKLDSTIKILIELLRYDRQEMLILTILQKFFIVLWKLSELDLNTNKYQLASKLGINAFFLDDYLLAIKKYPPEKIAHALNALMEADVNIKSSGADNLYIMISTVYKILSD
jgi:DNA polymerase-3 subunit delta